MFADGRRVRFFRSVGRTLSSIAAVDRREAESYGAFVRDGSALVELAVAGLNGGARLAPLRAYLAAPAAPAQVQGGWAAAGQRLAADLVAQVEARAPGWGASIREVRVHSPQDMERELRWPGAHPMVSTFPRPARPPAADPRPRPPPHSGPGALPRGRGAAQAVLADLRAASRMS